MSHFTYAPLPIAEVISERPTANLRWNNGILEQEWARETHSPHKAISHEWRFVPTVEHSPDANHLQGWTKVPAEPPLELLKSINRDNQALVYENGRYYNAWFEFEQSEGGWIWTDDADSEPNPSYYRMLSEVALDEAEAGR